MPTTLNTKTSRKITPGMIIGLLATGIGAYSLFPAPPKILIEYAEKYPSIRWGFVWILLQQGSGGFNEVESTIGVGATYILWTYLNSLREEDDEDDEEEDPGTTIITTNLGTI